MTKRPLGFGLLVESTSAENRLNFPPLNFWRWDLFCVRIECNRFFAISPDIEEGKNWNKIVFNFVPANYRSCITITKTAPTFMTDAPLSTSESFRGNLLFEFGNVKITIDCLAFKKSVDSELSSGMKRVNNIHDSWQCRNEDLSEWLFHRFDIVGGFQNDFGCDSRAWVQISPWVWLHSDWQSWLGGEWQFFFLLS